RAWRIEEHGGPDRLLLVDREAPAPGPGEVRVAVRAFALNHLDVWVRRGVPGHRFPLPLTPSSDGAGVVDAVGPGVTGLAPGDEVLCFPGVSCGRCERCLSGQDHRCRAYGILGESTDGLARELAVLPAVNVHPKPASLSFVEAASFPLSALTAWNMLAVRARVEPGETVLVRAGASGVGVHAIQVARLLGAEVWAEASTAAKRDLCAGLGAAVVFDPAEGDLAEAVRARSGRRGVEVVVDHVGKATFAGSLRCLAWGGRYVTCGATTGTDAGLDLAWLFFKGLSLLGSTMGSKGDLLRLARLFDRGALRPVVGAVLHGLDRYPEAVALLEERKAAGKVVVSLEPTGTAA
ncbi:MAG: zinc-binding dehydrogenase, partial [Planctomycetota bacterium]